MLRRPPRSTRTEPFFPYTALVRSTRMTTLTRADWEQRARDLTIEGRAFINGEYTDAVSGETFDCLSPVDGRVLGKIASCDVADAQRAVENARATFNSGVRSEEHTSELQSLMRISYAVFCLQK